MSLDPDISQLKDALAETENRLATLINAAPLILWSIAPDGTITLSEGKGLAALGLTPGQLVGSNVFEVYKDFPDATDAIRRCMAGEAFSYRTKVQDTYWDNSYTPRFGKDGRVSSVVGISADVTARTLAELERERIIKELEGKNAELEQFSYTVSHDLKRPLTTILSFSELIARDLAAGKSERAQERLAVVREAGERMRNLLDDLLTLARVGHKSQPPERVDLAALLGETLAMFNPLPAPLAIDDNLPPVMADRQRLAAVLQNLLDNAFKFTAHVAKPRLRFGFRQGPNGSEYFLEDNGLGIAAPHQKKIFEIFEKLDPQSPGTGIGLAIAKRVIDDHGGQLWVESAGPDQGSRFCFTLPLAESALAR